ncbi:uncharacterized protein BCR38DRAFT_448234 [Pseudomassariella vexata]|uniref:Uncharacterized protein n=1 Tax=Pseudomassariella vexata TaxID=1141098 RepID=A0A1Y2DFU0_9PEZI|nr:uncharacterized protein BCR38DRAFT_448234 [Pseudomassariella vexata]ORY58152.1 hypothetical protein BCR38DRAFT_448234 [Pseudomassariella vexata]
MPSSSLGHLGRLLFLSFLLGLMTVILYYRNIPYSITSHLEQFMDCESFGVTFLFTAAGSAIAHFRAIFFNSKSPQTDLSPIAFLPFYSSPFQLLPMSTRCHEFPSPS